MCRSAEPASRQKPVGVNRGEMGRSLVITRGLGNVVSRWLAPSTISDEETKNKQKKIYRFFVRLFVVFLAFCRWDQPVCQVTSPKPQGIYPSLPGSRLRFFIVIPVQHSHASSGSSWAFYWGPLTHVLTLFATAVRYTIAKNLRLKSSRFSEFPGYESVLSSIPK